MAKAGEYKQKHHKLFPVIITGNEEISPGVHVISWKRNCSFSPGQVVKIAMQENDQPRIYSICSGNLENEIKVLFNVKEEGELSPKLAACIPGDIVFASKAYGSFIGDDKTAFWIATGTGIAPFYSMFRSGQENNKILIHGVRFLNQFYFEDELEWAMGERYIRCCSRQQSRDVFPGRVTGYLDQIKELPSDYQYYLCGKALMVVEVRDLLIKRGVPYDNIIAEIYF